MEDFVFVTGNVHKVHWLEVFLGKKLLIKSLIFQKFNRSTRAKLLLIKQKLPINLLSARCS
jgi:hypothetical protein